MNIKKTHTNNMFCFYTYRRTLSILKEREDSLQRPYTGIQLIPTGGERPFEVDMVQNNYFLKTKYTNDEWMLNIMFHIIIHLYTTHYYLSLPEDTNIGFTEKFVSDHFLDCYLDSKTEAYEDHDHQFEDEDFRDIFEKYHYVNFPEEPEFVKSFFDSLNNRELIRVMKLVSWLTSPDGNVTIHNEGTYPQDDLTKIFTIDRMIEMNEAIIEYWEDIQDDVSIQKSRLLNACLGFYIRFKMEDRILGMFEFYSIDIFDFSENLSYILFHSLNRVLYKLVSEKVIHLLYDLENMRNIDGYQRLSVALDKELPNNEEDENREHVIYIKTNLQFILMLRGGREDFELIQYIESNPNIKFKIPKQYIRKLVEKPLVIHYMFKNNRISKRRTLYQIFIELMYITEFKDILPYIPIQVLCDFDFDKYTDENLVENYTIYEYSGFREYGILFHGTMKRQICQKYIESKIPSYLPIYLKNHIYDYLIKH